MVRRATSRTSPEPERGLFEALYLEHHGFVGRCLARWGIAPAAVDDARQDVFLTAYRRMHTIEDDASTRAWLAGISRRIAWRHRRTRERHDRRVDALAKVRPEVVSLEDWVRTREAVAVLDAFVAALDPPKREAFVLCELEGLSAREAADATGVNQATLYSRLRVARASFVSMCASLQQDGIEVRSEEAAAIHQRSQTPDSGAAMRGWMLLAPELLSAGTTTALLAKPVLLAALVVGGIGASSAAALSGSGVAPPVSPAAVEAPAARAAVGAAPSGPRTPPVRQEPELAPPVTPEPRPAKPLARPKPVSKRAEPPPAEGDLAAQVELLGVAESHLSRSESKEALDAATLHLKSWPKGPLAADAVRIAVRAHCAASDFESAVALVEVYLPDVDAYAWAKRRCKKEEDDVMNSPPRGD